MSMGRSVRSRDKRNSEGAPSRSGLFNNLNFRNQNDRQSYGRSQNQNLRGRNRYENNNNRYPQGNRGNFRGDNRQHYNRNGENNGQDNRNYDKYNRARKDPFDEYRERKDCILVRSLPKYYNTVNYLSKYFQK